MWLVVGLGNPGPKYEYTRHNIGFLTLDRLIEATGAHPLSSSSFHGRLFKASSTLLLKPETFMNQSGVAVQAVQHFYKISMDRVIVIHDDLDLPFGAVRFKKGGGHGGHNGLRSIDASVGNGYIRVRMGIDKPSYRSEVASYVLSLFTEQERVCLPSWIDHAAQAVQALWHQPFDRVATNFTCKDGRTLCH